MAGKTVSADPPPYPIAAVDNALRVLQLMKDRRSVRVSEVSAELGIARSSAHRLLAMLAYRGFARQDPETKSYKPGPALIELGLEVIRDMDIRAAARPHMERLSRDTGETISLVILEQARVLFIDCVEGPQSIRVASRTGRSMPAHCTSTGKAMLATLPPERLRELYPSERLETMTDRSLSTFAALEIELGRIRDAGYATNLAESEAEVRAVGVAILGVSGEALGGFSASAPASRFDPGRIPGIAEALQRSAARVGRYGDTP